MKITTEIVFASGKTEKFAKYKYKSGERESAGLIQDIAMSDFEKMQTQSGVEANGGIKEVRVYMSGSTTPLTFPAEWLLKKINYSAEIL